MTAQQRSTQSPRRRPGSQSALRHLNQQRIIDCLLSGPSTQAELSRQTGLSTATISNIVKVLQDAGLVSTSATTSSGRRATNVRLNSNGAVAVGMEFGSRHLRVVLASLGYQLIGEDYIELPRGHQADVGIAAAVQLLEKLLRKNGIDRTAVLGVGAGFPGPIDRRTGSVAQGALLPEWVGIDILRRLEVALNLPVFVDNDANFGALAEVTWGPHSDVSNLVYLKIGSGVGAGLILNGFPFHGNMGITGEIAHLTIHEHGSVCRCGNRGCLETVASTAMIELLGRGQGVALTPQEMIRNCLAGDSATRRVVEDAGLAVGRALGNVANLVNPEVIVIGGPLAGLGDLLLHPIRRGLVRHTVPLLGETTHLAMSSLGPCAEALGAAASVFQILPVRNENVS